MRGETRKQRLQIMCDFPELRDEMINQERHCEQEEEKDTLMMEKELEKNPLDSQPVLTLAWYPQKKP